MYVHASTLATLTSEGTGTLCQTSIIFMKDLQTHIPHEDDLDWQQFHFAGADAEHPSNKSEMALIQ